MLAGSIASERRTASPRKTCVPGGHANAGDGKRGMATMAITAATTRGIAAGRAPIGLRVTLYAEALALTTDGFAEIAQLGLDDVRDGLTRGVERIADFFADRIHRYAIPQLLAAFRRPPRALAPALAGPPCRAHRGATRGTRDR